MKESFKASDFLAFLFEGEIIEWADNESFKNQLTHMLDSF